MKDILFGILVALLTPVYIIIHIIKSFLEWFIDVTMPITELVFDFNEDMADFWKKFFKIKEKRRR